MVYIVNSFITTPPPPPHIPTNKITIDAILQMIELYDMEGGKLRKTKKRKTKRRKSNNRKKSKKRKHRTRRRYKNL